MKQEKNRSIIYIAVFIGLIMALSVIGFLWGGSEGKYRYGKFSFYYENGQWKTNVDGKILVFNILPDELQNITVPQEAIDLISDAKMLYITYEKSDVAEELAVAQYKLGINIETDTRFVVNSLAYENENNVPVITCSNATDLVPVIMMKRNETTNSITLNNNCITLEGNVNMLADRIVYSIYGIVK